jgi:hypothetical protein
MAAIQRRSLRDSTIPSGAFTVVDSAPSPRFHRGMHALCTMTRILTLLALAQAAAGCGKTVPSEVQSVLDAQHAAAVKVAADAAAACPGAKGSAPFQPNPMAAPPPPPNPAKGTSLEADARVVDVFIMCSWPDPRDATHATWAGTSLPSLRGTSTVPALAVTMPEDMAVNTCKKDPHNCEQVIVPSRHSKAARSADLRLKRPTPDGGEVEVRVIFAVP